MGVQKERKAHVRRVRAVALPDSEVARLRNRLYRAVLKRVKAASEAGFYLEAITLIESLITDRLESRYSFLLASDVSFKTLGALIDLCRSRETDAPLKGQVLLDLDRWRAQRNNAIHEMAKLESGDSTPLEERIAQLLPLTKEGLRIFRGIDRRVASLRSAGEG